MTKISKIVFEDGSEITKESTTDFQEIVLNHLDEYDIKSYSEWHLDLIEKHKADEHCDCSKLEYASDCEILEEAKSRHLNLNTGKSLLLDDLQERFSKILNSVNPIQIEEIIKNIENQ